MNRPVAHESFAAFEVGGTFTKAALFSLPGGKVVDELKFNTPATSAEICGSIVGAHRRFNRVALDAGREIVHVGVSLPTAVDPDTGELGMCGNIPDLHSFPWRASIEDATKTPCLIMNDAKAALVGETGRGAAQGVTDACLLIVGTGVGASFMIGGRLVHGRKGAAGEVGYMPLLGTAGRGSNSRRVALHEVLGAPSLLDEYARLSAGVGFAAGSRDLEHLLGQSAVDQDGSSLLARVTERIVGILVVLDSVLASDLYVLAGGIGTSKAVVDAVRETLAAQAAGIRVVPALLGDRAGLIGLVGWQEACIRVNGDAPSLSRRYPLAPNRHVERLGPQSFEEMK